MELQATLKPGEQAPPVRSLFAYFLLMIVVSAVYLGVRVMVLRAAGPLAWDLYLSEVVFFFIPLVLVLLLYRLDFRRTLQLRPVAWRRLPLFAVAGGVLVAFQVFLLALGSRLVPDIVRYIDLNNYLGNGTFTKTLLVLPVAGQVWVACVAPAFVEELLFRGFVQTTLVGRLGPQRGILATGALFALVHLGMLRVPFDILVSYIMGYLVIRHRSVWPAVVFHLTVNAVNLAVITLIPGYDTEQLSAASLALMGAAIVYLGWKIVRMLQRASAELRAEEAGMP